MKCKEKGCKGKIDLNKLMKTIGDMEKELEEECKEHPFWKGGRVKIKDGYIRLLQPNHPRQHGGYVLEHIFIWEEVNGKPLPKGWIIHHLNGIRDDNRIVNLIAMPDHKHRRLLEAKAKRIQELESLLSNQGHLL